MRLHPLSLFSFSHKQCFFQTRDSIDSGASSIVFYPSFQWAQHNYVRTTIMNSNTATSHQEALPEDTSPDTPCNTSDVRIQWRTQNSKRITVLSRPKAGFQGDSPRVGYSRVTNNNNNNHHHENHSGRFKTAADLEVVGGF